jgi:putative inorganic carbon (hco3(-)) transporter
MIAANVAASAQNPWRPVAYLVQLPLQILHAWASAPVFLFLLTLAAMLFRPPDLKAFPIDRIALAMLIGCIALRLCGRVDEIQIYPATWPLLALTLFATGGLLSSPFQAQSWSLLAAKWIVPLVLFQLAGAVFRSPSDLRRLELFCLIVLLYLSVVSAFFLLNAKSLIFPRFILDPDIGIHVDRARGPFLQAVANGVSLNILGLVALNSFRRSSLPGPLATILFVAVPLALLATKTRAVWISAAFSITAVVLFCRNRKLRRAAVMMGVFAAVGILTFFAQSANSRDFVERVRDQSPLDFRSEIYSAGWLMFTERPLLGWGDDANMQAEVARRVSKFRPDYYVFHNTFLELAVQKGIVGLGLYGWLTVCLFRLGRDRRQGSQCFVDAEFRQLWPVILAVYFINASAVVMNYQFVNGLLFTFAGILAAQKRAASEPLSVRQDL